jgi:hypothetical protein
MVPVLGGATLVAGWTAKSCSQHLCFSTGMLPLSIDA